MLINFLLHQHLYLEIQEDMVLFKREIIFIIQKKLLINVAMQNNYVLTKIILKLNSIFQFNIYNWKENILNSY